MGAQIARGWISKDCEKCGSDARREDAPLYLSRHNFVQTLENSPEEFRALACEKCGDVLGNFAFAVGYQPWGFVLFATPDGDHPGVLEEWIRFRTALDDAKNGILLSEFPFVLVHGVRGAWDFEHLFSSGKKQDLPILETADSTSHEWSPRPESGFRHGEIFFYYPELTSLSWLTSLPLLYAAVCREIGSINDGIMFLHSFVHILGNNHPWIAEEMARLYLSCGNEQEAQKWLGEAIRLQRRWLGVTVDFVDATDVVDRKQSLVSLDGTNSGSSVGRSVLRQRHVVTLISKCYDHGRWNFERLRSHLMPAEAILGNHIAALGSLFGQLDRDFFSVERPLPTSETVMRLADRWAIKIVEAVQTLADLERDGRIEVFAPLFILNFVVKRFHTTKFDWITRRRIQKLVDGHLKQLQSEAYKTEPQRLIIELCGDSYAALIQIVSLNCGHMMRNADLA